MLCVEGFYGFCLFGVFFDQWVCSVSLSTGLPGFDRFSAYPHTTNRDLVDFSPMTCV